jgi:hypothetical protein
VHGVVLVKIIGLVSGMNTLDWLRCSERDMCNSIQHTEYYQRLQSTPYIYSSVIAQPVIPMVTLIMLLQELLSAIVP